LEDSEITIMQISATVFLCHASEDNQLARRLAEGLVAQGISVFYDEWEIRAGDSIRRKIDGGLEGCTHFVALLTPNSLHKEWVKTEIDAAFIRKVDGLSRFISLRYQLPVADLPPLLRASYSPSLDNFEADLKKLICDIYDVTLRPQLGTPPSFVDPAIEKVHGLSIAAFRIAGEFLRRSENGREGDPALRVEELLATTDLAEEDLAEAVEELEKAGFATPLRGGGTSLGYSVIWPTSSLFAELDSALMEWVPNDDARRLAADLVNGEGHISIPGWADQEGWQARQVNPALTYLFDRGLVNRSNSVSQPFISNFISKNVKTRRFVLQGT